MCVKAERGGRMRNPGVEDSARYECAVCGVASAQEKIEVAALIGLQYGVLKEPGVAASWRLVLRGQLSPGGETTLQFDFVDQQLDTACFYIEQDAVATLDDG